MDRRLTLSRQSRSEIFYLGSKVSISGDRILPRWRVEDVKSIRQPVGLPLPSLSCLSYQRRTCCSIGNTAASGRSGYNRTSHPGQFYCRLSKQVIAGKHCFWEQKRDRKKPSKHFLYSFNCKHMIYHYILTLFQTNNCEWAQSQNSFYNMLESQRITVACILHSWFVKAEIILDDVFRLSQLKLQQWKIFPKWIFFFLATPWWFFLLRLLA